jgi:hypothetical protein
MYALTMPAIEPPVPRLATAAPTLVVAGPAHPQRAAIERHIAAVYRARFGARVAGFAPVLVGLPIDGRIVAAAGYRRAFESLYLERYLDGPVEAAIRSRTGAAIDRAHIVEIGHFASTRHGAGRRLMTLLARHLLSVGARWAATTATQELRLLYDRLGLQAWWLADARPGAVGEQASDWGRYYEHAPAVLAGPIARNLAILERRGP